MRFPFLLLFLLALPVVVAAVILAASALRRRRPSAAPGPAGEPLHRLQADSATVQDAAVHPAENRPEAPSGRARRARAALGSRDR